MSEFKREELYYVIKITDAAQFSDTAKDALIQALYAAQIVRKLRGAPALECVVVESDWPEYEPVWDMIQARVEGKPNQIATLQSDLAAAREELARAKPALIKAWEIFFTRSFSQDPIGRAEARYAREIAHKGEEG